MKKSNDVIRDKSYAFAIRIVKLSQYLQSDHKEYVLSSQIIKSGTSIGALVREGHFAQSKLDFIHKLSIALKEANETFYWLSLLHDTGYIQKKLFHSLIQDCDELISILVSIVKTSKSNMLQNKVRGGVISNS